MTLQHVATAWSSGARTHEWQSQSAPGIDYVTEVTCGALQQATEMGMLRTCCPFGHAMEAYSRGMA